MSSAWVVAGDGSLQVAEHPAPSPQEHEVVVAVRAAAVPRWQLGAVAAVPGWAAVGRVVAAGEQALALLDRYVLVGPSDPCGQCEVCRRGGHAMCPNAPRRGDSARGTLAERITVAARWVVPLAEAGLGAAEAQLGALAPLAALGGEAALAYTAYARSDLAPKEPVLLVGDGPIARLLVQILLAKGIAPVVLVEPGRDESARAHAALGARVVPAAVSSSAAPEALAEVQRSAFAALAEEPARGRDGASRPWRFLVTEPSALPLAAALAGPRATITVIAPGPCEGAAAPASLWAREVAVLGVAAPSPELLLETAALVAKGQLRLDAATQVLGVDELAAPGAAARADRARALVAVLPA